MSKLHLCNFIGCYKLIRLFNINMIHSLLNTSFKGLPAEWEEYLIRYNDSKESLSGIVNEMRQCGLSIHVLNDWLQSSRRLGDDALLVAIISESNTITLLCASFHINSIKETYVNIMQT
jgi:hypothetical protein